jgi:hypothetical protein
MVARERDQPETRHCGRLLETGFTERAELTWIVHLTSRLLLRQRLFCDPLGGPRQETDRA